METPYRIELFIESLTGTVFRLLVSPFETILSVKLKINNLEGIPIQQQHLIFNSVELNDDSCLYDYNVHYGATLKLVLDMRGGPINTRRTSVEDSSVRDMADYIEWREEIVDQIPPLSTTPTGSPLSNQHHVTVLVLQDGDRLKFFRFIDARDELMTAGTGVTSVTPPIPDFYSRSGTTSVQTRLDSEARERRMDNLRTHDKMKLLQAKMNTSRKDENNNGIPKPAPNSEDTRDLLAGRQSMTSGDEKSDSRVSFRQNSLSLTSPRSGSASFGHFRHLQYSRSSFHRVSPSFHPEGIINPPSTSLINRHSGGACSSMALPSVSEHVAEDTLVSRTENEPSLSPKRVLPDHRLSVNTYSPDLPAAANGSADLLQVADPNLKTITKPARAKSKTRRSSGKSTLLNPEDPGKSKPSASKPGLSSISLEGF